VICSEPKRRDIMAAIVDLGHCEFVFFYVSSAGKIGPIVNFCLNFGPVVDFCTKYGVWGPARKVQNRG